MRPVSVVIHNEHYLGPEFAKSVPCAMYGRPLECTWSEEVSNGTTWEADALWYHAPTLPRPLSAPYELVVETKEGEERGPSFRRREGQLVVVFSMESEVYVPILSQPQLLALFDVEMSYRLSAQILTPYYSDDFLQIWRQQPPLPTSEKVNGIVHLSRNCLTPGQREILVDALHMAGLRVDYKGSCQFNRSALEWDSESAKARDIPDKHALFRQYRFCICMENSLAMDYVSEKVYQGLAAGCLPIYWGAPNIQDLLPAPEAVIDASQYPTLTELVAEVRRLSENDTAYEERMAWRSRTVREWPHVLQDVRRRVSGGTSQCQVCQLVALKRWAGLQRSASRLPRLPWQ